MKTSHNLLFVLSVAIIVAGCANMNFGSNDKDSAELRATQHARSSRVIEPQSQVEWDQALSEGYAQLYAIASALKCLDVALDFKFINKDVGKLGKDTSTFFTTLKARLEKLDRDYPSLSLDNDGLPYIERKTRQAIAEHLIVFFAPIEGLHGAEFERELLLVLSGVFEQQQFLASTLLEVEKSAPRKELLTEVVNGYQRLCDEAKRILKADYFRA